MTDTITGTANKASQRELVQVLQNEGHLDRVGDFVRPDVVDHDRPAGMPEGAAGVKAVFAAIREGFPDHDAQVVHMIAEGDLVATYKTLTGTNTGELFGMPATGRRATIRIMDFVRYRDGLVAEHWGLVDLAGLQAQLAAD